MESIPKDRKIYQFDGFRLIPGEGLLLRNGVSVALNMKSLGVLTMLVERHGHLVTKSEIIETVWEDTFVEEGSLTKAIWMIRQALGDTSKERFIQTVPRRGYRFIFPVSVIKDASGAFRVEDLRRLEHYADLSEEQTAITDGTGGGSLVHAKTPVGGSVEDPKIDFVIQSDVEEMYASNPRGASNRRTGFRRGFRIFVLGIGVGFVFLVLLQSILIARQLLFQYYTSINQENSGTALMAGDLLTTLSVPIGLGWFLGIGLCLFGIFRMIYAAFEREGSKIRPLIIERILAGLVCLLLLSVAIPNLLYSYRVSSLAGQLNKGLTANSATGSRRSIAILPSVPINLDERSMLYERGIADALISRLSTAEGLRVRPLSAVAGYEEANTDPVAAGRELKVDYVLASNYQIADGQIKVTSQLYNVATGQVEDTFPARLPITDTFAAQDAIAADIGGRIMARLGTSTRAPSTKGRGTDNAEAYLAYTQGMYLLDRQHSATERDETSPVEFFDKAVALDPKFARAWAGKAMAHYISLEDRESEEHQKAREAVEKALSIDPNESLAYTALCHQRLYDEWDYSGAEEAGRRAVELDPASPLARSEYATLLNSRGRFAEALDQIGRAMEMEPLSFRNQAVYANVLFAARRFEEAERQYKKLFDLKPDRTATYWWLVEVMDAQGKEAESYEWTVKLMEAEHREGWDTERFKAAYARGGYKEALFERANQAVMAAHAYVLLGDKDKAFEKLERNFNRHSYHLAVFGLVDPLYDSLHSDPRWADLERRVRGG